MFKHAVRKGYDAYRSVFSVAKLQYILQMCKGREIIAMPNHRQ